MITGILSHIICATYEDEVDQWRSKSEENKEGMLVTFCIRDDERKQGKNPCIELLIWGQYKYTGVYMRRTSRNPDKKTPWEVLSYHDSCWRDDGVDTFLFEHEKDLICLGDTIMSPTWYQRMEITDDLKEELYQVRKKRYK